MSRTIREGASRERIMNYLEELTGTKTRRFAGFTRHSSQARGRDDTGMPCSVSHLLYHLRSSLFSVERRRGKKGGKSRN